MADGKELINFTPHKKRAVANAAALLIILELKLKQ